MTEYECGIESMAAVEQARNCAMKLEVDQVAMSLAHCQLQGADISVTREPCSLRGDVHVAPSSSQPLPDAGISKEVSKCSTSAIPERDVSHLDSAYEDCFVDRSHGDNARSKPALGGEGVIQTATLKRKSTAPL